MALETNIYIKKSINDLIPGDIILHPIYRADGLMLVNKHKVLSMPLLNLIKNHALPNLFVLTVSSPEELHNFLTEKESNHLVFKEDIAEFVKDHNFNDSTDTILNLELDNDNQLGSNEVFTKILSNSPLWVYLDSKFESKELKDRANLIKELLIETMDMDETFIILFDKIKNYDDILLIHSINVTCLSLMIGLTLELSNDNLLDLCIAALFLNVGFTEMPKVEFKRYLRTPKSVQEIVKKQIEVFSDLTLDSSLLRRKSIIYAILDHHEFFNGTGYPNGKKGEEISLLGRILSIVKNYDGLVGGYNYTLGALPLSAFKMIYENKDNKFDKRILDIFLHRTTFFKIGQRIPLKEDQNAVIVGFDDYINAPHLPIVKFENGLTLSLNNKYYRKADSK